MSNILVSIVMITYGHEKYIAESINSVLKQKVNFPVELIIANDASPDNSDEVIKKVIENVPENFEVRYTKHAANKGIMQNFLWALQQAKGKYIALCEGDDYWIDDNKIQFQVGFMEKNSDFSMCCHNAYIVIENGVLNKKFNNYKISQELSINKIMNDWIIPTASILFRRESLPTLPSWAQEIYSGDYTLALLLAYKGKIMFLNRFSSIYRVTTNSSSATSIYNKKPFFILDQHRFLLKKFNEESEGKYAGLIKKRLKHIDKEERFIKFYMKGKLLPLIFTPLTALKRIFKKINF